MSVHVLAVDAGKSRLRVALYADGARVRALEGPGVPHSAEAGAAQRVAMGVAEVARQLDVPQLDVIAAGLTGVRGPGPAARAVAAALRDVLPAGRTLVTSDVVVAHVGALAGEPGTVVVAGTGAIALAMADDGRTARADGWGYLLGDDGSGFALGRQGLAAALRALDGRPDGSPALLEAARERFGDAAALVDAVYGAALPARAVAAFAPAVVAAADAGDPVAGRACAAAGAALADTAVAAARGAGVEQAAFSWQGGLLEAGRIAERFVAALAERLPGASLAPPRGDGLDGAALLAAGGGRIPADVAADVA